MAKRGTKDRSSDLAAQQDFEEHFNSWFRQGLESIIEDNRRRYRMELKDKEEREKRGLSTIPSTKSTSVVDRAVGRAVMEYHGDPDAITFTAKNGTLEPDKEMMAQLLTELFQYRSKHTFPFFTWHVSSLTNGFTDGLEAAMVYWRKEGYKKKVSRYFYRPAPPPPQIDPMTGQPVPPAVPPVEEIDEELYRQLKDISDLPGEVFKEDFEEEVVTTDSWWIDSLKPGEDLLWDFKAPLLDISMGERCLVKARRSLDQLRQMKKQGLLDKFKEEEAARYLRAKTENIDHGATTGDTEAVDADDLNRAEVWIFFDKVESQWMVSFSLEGEVELSGKKPVNDVFFGGRQVDRLPIVMGTHKMKLWEAVGRGDPETIAPIEDELADHRNNLSDAAKLSIQGRWRVSPNSDVDFDDLLNGRMFLADTGEVEKIDQQLNMIDTMRVADSLGQDLAELASVGMENRHVVPRGSGRTLGAIQLAMGHQDEKLSVQLITRNQTFFEHLLYLIAQLELAYETDETLIRVAGKRRGVEVPQTVVGGQMAVDLSQIDLEVEVNVNAGRGAMAKDKKAQLILQIAQVRQQMGIPTDMQKVARQLNILAGFDPQAFDLAQPPAPPKPDISGNVNIDLHLLPPEVQQMIVKGMLEGGNITVNAQGRDDRQNQQSADMGADPGDMPPDPMDSAGGVEPGGQGGY